ncbi:MAG: pilus assembly FimT family protein [Gammaproteobacteria bacterium]
MPYRIAPAVGHTLVEILVVMGLAAVLATLAVPTFSAWVLDSRRDATVVAALHAIHFARQFAAVRGEAVKLCGSREGLRCSGLADWSAGFLVSNSDGSLRRALPAGVAADSPQMRSNRPVVRFEGGTGHATPATLTICDRRGAAAARAVIISRSGRPRVESVATGSGTPC